MGCIREVSQLQALTEKESFKRTGVRMVGVSADSVEKQKVFAQKQKLTVSCLVRGRFVYCSFSAYFSIPSSATKVVKQGRLITYRGSGSCPRPGRRLLSTRW